MEMLDTYTEEKELIGPVDRDTVHEKGLWHKTVHCWLFDYEGNVYFQIRNNEGFYTTASGHVKASETINEAFDREVKEEIGLDVDESKIIFIDEYIWQQDKIKNDKEYHDRAFANIWMCPFDGVDTDFQFNDEEVSGVVKVNAKETKKLFLDDVDTINAHIISKDGILDKKIVKTDFLLTKGETYINKYGKVLDSIINETSK